MSKLNVIAGCSGQDGSYLAEYLLGKGERVVGFSRRTAVHSTKRIDHLISDPNFTYLEGDVDDQQFVWSLIAKYKPDKFFNLAAQSHVHTSFTNPASTFNIDTIGVLNILEAIRTLSPNTKFYQASTSEMFGSNYSFMRDVDQWDILTHSNEYSGKKEYPRYQDELTPFSPNSPYAIAKLAAHHLVRLYRESYGLKCCAGILFNHECLSSYVPILYKKHNVIHIDNISDFFKVNVNGSNGYVDESIKIWDQSGWVDIKYASSFQHDLNKNKGLRIINSRNSVYAVTNDHVCIKEDNSESASKNLKIGDKLKLIPYPSIEDELILDLEFCEMIGMLVGDGHIKDGKGQFTNKSPIIRDRFEYLWKKFGGDCSYYPSTSGFTKETVGRLDLRNVKMVLEGYDLYTELLDIFGHRYKKIPYQILNASIDCMESFLVGYNVCDGLKSNPCVYSFKNFKTNSATLAAGLLFLVSKVTLQKYNITIEESWKHGKQQFYYSINLLSDRKSSIQKYEAVSKLIQRGISQREIHRKTNISRAFIQKVKNGYIPNNTHHLELCNNEIKKIIDIPNYDGWFFDLETSSGTFHAGIGQAVVHNSPRRGDQFVTQKIIKWIVGFPKWQLQAGSIQPLVYEDDYIKHPWSGSRYPKLRLGNLDASRDWGHAKDYVVAMDMMLESESCNDYVVATGETHTIREFLTEAFSLIGISDWTEYVVIDPKFIRPSEVPFLRGDSSLIRQELGWAPKTTFKELVKDMYDSAKL